MNTDVSWQAVIETAITRHQTGPSWRPFLRLIDGESPTEGARGLVWIVDKELHAVAVMIDSDVFSRASGKADRTWLSGDVLELFVQPDRSSPPYFEYHVTPSGASLALRIPDATQLLADAYAFETLIYDSAGFCCHHGTMDGGWWGHLQVPLNETGLTDPAAARCCLCRYNYNKAWIKPELSSTAALSSCTSFHTPERWHALNTRPAR